MASEAERLPRQKPKCLGRSEFDGDVKLVLDPLNIPFPQHTSLSPFQALVLSHFTVTVSLGSIPIVSFPIVLKGNWLEKVT